MAGSWLVQRARPPRNVAYFGAGAMTLLGLSATGAAVAGLDALVRVRPRPDPPTARVAAVHPSDGPGCSVAVTLEGPGAAEQGWIGLVTSDGDRLLAGPAGPDGATRQATALAGLPAADLEVGQVVAVVNSPWDGCDDPFGLGARTSMVSSAGGPLAVTSVGPHGARRAVVYVHGRGGHRTSGWWLAPTCVAAGWRTVMPAYRNSADGGPVTGRYLLGGEWSDLVTVLDWLARQGVREVVLIGWSMGGNICASYLRQRYRHPDRFTHHPRPVGLVLDAAALDWGKVLVHVARQRRIPRHLVPLVMAYGQLALRIDWRDLNHLTDPEHLDLPILAFHGAEDDIVPAALSETLASRLPHIRLELVEGAGHCRSVNVEPVRYLNALQELLSQAG